MLAQVAAELVQIILPSHPLTLTGFFSLPSLRSTGRKLPYLPLPYSQFCSPNILLLLLHYFSFTTPRPLPLFSCRGYMQNTRYELRNTSTSSLSFLAFFLHSKRLLRWTTSILLLLAYLHSSSFLFLFLFLMQLETPLFPVKIKITFHVNFHIRETNCHIISPRKTLSFP